VCVCVCVCVCVLRNDQKKVQWQQIWSPAQHLPSAPCQSSTPPLERDSPSESCFHFKHRHAHPEQMWTVQDNTWTVSSLFLSLFLSLSLSLCVWLYLPPAPHWVNNVIWASRTPAGARDTHSECCESKRTRARLINLCHTHTHTHTHSHLVWSVTSDGSESWTCAR